MKEHHHFTFSHCITIQAFGGEFQMWSRVVCSLEFISTKCRLGLGSTLLEDYQEKGKNQKHLVYNLLVFHHDFIENR